MGQESQFRRLAGARKSKNSPPVLSTEFIIQNHGDIVSFVIMIFIAGLIFQKTYALASIFCLPQYNVTDPETEKTVYGHGVLDFATLFFYTLCGIVIHALIQEYGLDKLQRKLHLSKTKTSKFNESGHLLLFAIYSVTHTGLIIKNEGYLDEVSMMWAGYPDQHKIMSLSIKAFFLAQLAYWLHQFPEFFFQKIRRDEIRTRSTYSLLYLLFIGAAYALNFNRVAIPIMFLHFVAEAIFHLARMAHFSERAIIAKNCFKLWNILFVVVRLGCIMLTVLTFWYGLRINEVPYVDVPNGNFNTAFIRLNCLIAMCCLQAFMMWNFITFHLRRMRERSAATMKSQSRYQLRNKQQRKAAKKFEDEVSKLPEADQEASRAALSAKKTK